MGQLRGLSFLSAWSFSILHLLPVQYLLFSAAITPQLRDNSAARAVVEGHHQAPTPSLSYCSLYFLLKRSPEHTSTSPPIVFARICLATLASDRLGLSAFIICYRLICKTYGGRRLSLHPFKLHWQPDKSLFPVGRAIGVLPLSFTLRLVLPRVNDDAGTPRRQPGYL